MIMRFLLGSLVASLLFLVSVAGEDTTASNSSGVTTGKPRTVRFRMTVLDAPNNSSVFYNTTSGSTIIVGRNAKARADLYYKTRGSPPNVTDSTASQSSSTEGRSARRKGKILNSPPQEEDFAGDARIVNDPAKYAIRGFIPVLGLNNQNNQPEQPSQQQESFGDFGGTSAKRQQEYYGQGQSVDNSGYSNVFGSALGGSQSGQFGDFPRKPAQFDNDLSVFNGFDGFGSNGFSQRPPKRLDNPREFGNSPQGSYNTDLPPPLPPVPVEPSKDCICVPFYMCSKEGYLLSNTQAKGSGFAPPNIRSGPRPVPQSSNQVPSDSGLIIPIDERSNDKNSPLSPEEISEATAKQTNNETETETSAERQSRTRRSAEGNQERNATSGEFFEGFGSDQDTAAADETEERNKAPAAPAYATDIMQRMLGGGNYGCGVLRTCCRIPGGSNPNFLPENSFPGSGFSGSSFPGSGFSGNSFPGSSFSGSSNFGGFKPTSSSPAGQIASANAIPPEILAQLFPKKPAFENPKQGSFGGSTYPQDPFKQSPHGGKDSYPEAFIPPPGAGASYPKPIYPVQTRPESPYPTCGARNAFGVHGRVKNLQYPEAGTDFAEFPWHVGVMKRLGPAESLYVCGGVLIASQWIATAAHCLKTGVVWQGKLGRGPIAICKLRPQDIKIRLGEWDVHREDEFYPHVEKYVSEIVVHPEFFPGNLNNDIALIRMDSPVDLNAPNIAAACLPEAHEQYDGTRCWVTGWGKDAFGPQGAYQHVLKKVDVPIMNSGECQERLRQTRLGPYYNLHQGFVCAGGEAGKDACTGDGGSPMVCDYQGVWKVVGLVSWGIGCGTPGVPGVYVNMQKFRPWIEGVITRLG